MGHSNGEAKPMKITELTWTTYNDGSRTFRSLKAAKAYAVAIITLEQ